MIWNGIDLSKELERVSIAIDKRIEENRKQGIGGCDSCELVSIQGVVCHERGCRNSWIDPVTGNGYVQECDWCGSDFTATWDHQTVCDDSCAEAYWG